jgi:hypothetical protein
MSRRQHENHIAPQLRAFFALLRSGFYELAVTPEELSVVASLSASDWMNLTRLARQQAVPGLIYRAFTLLPRDVQVPGDAVLSLMARSEEIAHRNRVKAGVTERLIARFSEQGLTPLVMKGATVAAYYAQPELRESGDIDFYFPKGQLKAAAECLTAPTVTPDGITGKEEGVDIDLHDRYFDLHCATRKLPKPGTSEATLLMLSAHIMKHAIGTGIGIRQCCDVAAAYRALKDDVKPDELKALFRNTGTLRWNRLLFSFLTEWLGLDEQVFAEDRVSSTPLLQIILEGGNFGHYAATRQVALGASNRQRKRDTFRRFLRRLPFSLRYAPRETIFRIGDLLRGNLKPSPRHRGPCEE